MAISAAVPEGGWLWVLYLLLNTLVSYLRLDNTENKKCLAQ